MSSGADVVPSEQVHRQARIGSQVERFEIRRLDRRQRSVEVQDASLQQSGVIALSGSFQPIDHLLRRLASPQDQQLVDDGEQLRIDRRRCRVARFRPVLG
ncbi:MAG TPA: hypothetical protein DCQ98_07325 [Planctomycetaceae bacterium]|nr:hypothetical protein [Planctomycetaceae bacterium]